MKRMILLCVIVVLFLSVNAHTKMPSFFSSNMILQQNEQVSVWGKDNPVTKIKVNGSWGSRASAIVDVDSTWKVKLQTPNAGGSYTLTVKGNDEIVLTDVLVGEVWLCSGQSNMQWLLKNTNSIPGAGSNNDFLFSKNDQIRVFKTKRVPSEAQLYDETSEWKHSEPSVAGDFSAKAYWYGKVLQEILDVPVGLIVSCWGKSSVQAWMDEGIYAQFKDLPSAQYESIKVNRAPTLLYNAMIHPFISFNFKGVIRYIGESNQLYPEEYKLMFPEMIRLWRDKWQQGNFPFNFVQNAPYNYSKGKNSAFLRAAQLHTLQTVENTGMAITLDVGNCDDIHPKNKKTVALRLAYWSLAKIYGVEGIEYTAPIYTSMEKTENGKIELHFDILSVKLTTFDKEVTGFVIAGKDKVFYPANTKINKGKIITVWSNQVQNSVAVRYTFENCVDASLYNRAGFPVSLFRTDNWN